MEIIKPGKVGRAILKCPECGCEFVCSKSEMEYTHEAVFARCPQDGCGAAVEVPIGTTLRRDLANHTAVGSIEHPDGGLITVTMSAATVIEEPVGNEQYITKVGGVTKEAAERIRALGADNRITMMIDGKYPELFYMGDTDTLIAYEPHDGKLYEQE